MATMAAVICATAYVVWFSIVDRWIDPWARRLTGRVLGVRVERAYSEMGFLRTRTWVTVPADDAKAPLVTAVWAATTVSAALAPVVSFGLLVAQSGLPSRWSIAATLVAVLGSPIGVATQMFGEG